MPREQVARSTFLTALWLLVVYLTQVILAAWFGAGREMDAYLAGTNVPRFLTGVLVESLNVFFVPVFVEHRTRGMWLGRAHQAVKSLIWAAGPGTCRARTRRTGSPCSKQGFPSRVSSFRASTRTSLHRGTINSSGPWTACGVSIGNMDNVFFVVTIDTECDRSLSWRASNPLTFHSVVEGIPSRLQRLFRKYGCKPTYLVSWEVLEDAASVRTLRALETDQAELGTHLHGAYVPPQRVYRDPAGSETPEFQCHYSEALESAKLKNLTDLFRTRLDRTPTAFRAGRFGASARTLRLLEPLGYRVDTSVTPHMVWDEQIDFRSAPEPPYHPDAQDLNARGASTILEVPVTIGQERRHLLFRRPLWLRPSYSTAEQMITLCDSFVQKYGRQAPVVLNMMFHSMEVIPMASPYTRTEEECSELLGRIDQVLSYLASRGVKFVGLSELVGLL